MHPTDLQKLPPHPSLALIPPCDPDDPATESIVASVCDLGRVLEAVKICKGRTVDGRIRIYAAVVAGLDDVPTEEVDEAEAASVVLHSALARKHYTLSARAILAAPLLGQVAAESRKRSLENLRPVGKPKSDAPSSTSRTAEEVAEQFGISLRTLERAREIIKKLDAHPKLRAEWLAKIMSGESSLEQAMQGLSGKLAALDGGTHPKNDAGQLMLALFDTAAARLPRWDELGAKDQAEALQKFRVEFLPALPEAFHAEYRRFIKAQRSAVPA